MTWPWLYGFRSDTASSLLLSAPVCFQVVQIVPHEGKKTLNNPEKQKLDCLKPFKNSSKEGFLTSASQPANLWFSPRDPCGDIFSWMTNMNRLTGCEEDPQTKRHSLECAGCRGTKGGGGEVSPLCCVKPIEKSVSQEDQIPANPQCREAERKHK